MMVEKETSVCAHAKFPTLWEPMEIDGQTQYRLTYSFPIYRVVR
jgi:hypothetical protein